MPARAKSTDNITAEVKERTRQFLLHGVKPLDALHVALAKAGKPVYFCACDDRLRRQGKHIEDLVRNVVSPVVSIQEIEK